MSSKLKVILGTVVCTTIAWAVLIFGVLWYFSTQSDVVMAPLVDTGTGHDYCGIFSITNRDSHPVTLFLEELQTNTISSATGGVVLVQREIPPAGYFGIGFRRVKPTSKP